LAGLEGCDGGVGVIGRSYAGKSEIFDSAGRSGKCGEIAGRGVDRELSSDTRRRLGNPPTIIVVKSRPVAVAMVAVAPVELMTGTMACPAVDESEKSPAICAA